MRSAVYAVAVIAAAAIAYFVAAPAPQTASSPSTGAPEAVAASHQVMTEPGTLTLRVDDMHCPFACYPNVKKTLESQGNVVAVELDKQKQEDAIDNPQVLIKYEPGFDLTAAMQALDKKGFAKHSVVE